MIELRRNIQRSSNFSACLGLESRGHMYLVNSFNPQTSLQRSRNCGATAKLGFANGVPSVIRGGVLVLSMSSDHSVWRGGAQKHGHQRRRSHDEICLCVHSQMKHVKEENSLHQKVGSARWVDLSGHF